MILPPDKSCIRPISFYRVPNAFNRVNNAKRREMILKKKGKSLGNRSLPS